MSTASRSRRKSRRQQARKLAKAAKKALYKSYGEQKKQSIWKKSGRTGDEVFTSGCDRDAGCGNVGCFGCHPGPHNLPNRFRQLVLRKRLTMHKALNEACLA